MEDSKYNPKDEGQKVWHSLDEQITELRSFMLSMILSILHFFKRQFLLILIGLIVGVTLGYLKSASIENNYRSEMTVSYVHLEKKIYADMIVKANSALQSGSLGLIDGFDSLSMDALASLKSINASNIKGEPLIDDLTAERIPFNVVVEVSDPLYFKDIEKAIVRYLNSPDFVQTRFKYNREKAETNIDFFKQTAEALNDRLANSEPTEDDDYESIMEALLSAHEAMQEAEAQLYFNENIEVLHGLSAGSAQLVNDLRKPILIGALAGIALALLVGFFRPNRAKL